MHATKSMGLAVLALASTVSAFIPPTRWAPECTLIKQTVYCYGGESIGPTDNNNLYALDVSQTFNVSTNPPWTDRTSDAGSVATSSVAYFALAPLPGGSFIINGGSSNVLDRSIPNDTMRYDGVNHNWTIPTISGVAMVQRREHSAAYDDQGKVYFWGGLSDQYTYNGPPVYYNTFVVLDTTAWSYSYPTPASAPYPRIQHTTTFVNGKIYILGGLSYSPNITNPTGSYVLNAVSMSDIPMYDTVAGTWVNATAMGDIPSSRRGHTAVVAPGGKSIIVFGGANPSSDTNNLNDVYQFNVEYFTWLYTNATGTLPLPRKDASSVMVGPLMLVLFGWSNNQVGLNDINVLDTRYWTWVQTYSPNGTATIPSSPTGDSAAASGSGSSGLGMGAIVGIVVGIVVIIVIALVLCFCVRRRKGTNQPGIGTNSPYNATGQPWVVRPMSQVTYDARLVEAPNISGYTPPNPGYFGQGYQNTPFYQDNFSAGITSNTGITTSTGITTADAISTAGSSSPGLHSYFPPASPAPRYSQVYSQNVVDIKSVDPLLMASPALSERPAHIPVKPEHHEDHYETPEFIMMPLKPEAEEDE